MGARQQLAALAEAGNPAGQGPVEVQPQVLEAALGAIPAAQIVVDTAGTLALANNAAQDLFALTPADCGRPLQDLEISYRPVELRSLIERAYRDGRPVRVSDVEKPMREGGEPHCLDLEVTPLRDAQGAAVGVSVSFLDHTERTRLRHELERTREELEHSNEELQSANEELETTNEELQSTNEELRSMNEQLQQRTRELHENQSFLEAILRGIGAAVVVVDRELRILSWEEKMQDLWGLRLEEVRGKSLLELDIGLPVKELRPAIEACLRGDAEQPTLEVDAVNRRGASIRCSALCTPLRQDGEIMGVIVMIERVDGPGGVAEPGARAASPGRLGRKR